LLLKKYSTSSNAAAKRNANQRFVRATRPGFLAQSSANAKAKETAPIFSMHNTKQATAMKVAPSLLTIN